MSTPVPSLSEVLASAVSRAVEVVAPEAAGADPLVRPSEHADAQSNVAMALAKRLRRKPADVAADIAAKVNEESGPLKAVEVSGPGFLNLTLKDDALWQQVVARLGDERWGIAEPEKGRTTVIDYPSPNVAKEMHVGHLRSMVIGDCLARVFGFLGSNVIRQNHIGDWGTQFGMLIQYLEEHPENAWRSGELRADTGVLAALNSLYKAAQVEFAADPEFADRARRRVVALQAGDPKTVQNWKEVVTESVTAFAVQYKEMGLLLTPQDNVGESFYNPMLPTVVQELVDSGLAVDSRGALCAFPDGFTGPDDEPIPLIVRKADGGFGYAATDLAAIRHRNQTLGADRILYVVDTRQSMHFQMVFATAAAAGWLGENCSAEHINFGTVLGADGKPIKTRSGETVRLASLVDSAVQAARVVIEAKNAERSEPFAASEVEKIAHQAGVAALKYADLSNARTKDYQLDIERMVALNGDTGVYLQYAHTRVSSILAKASQQGLLTHVGDDGWRTAVDQTVALEPAERALILSLDGFGEAIRDVAKTCEPHRLCGYLYRLARSYTDFYANCPVLNAPSESVRNNRLALCALTQATLAHGLSLLGIESPERL